MSRPARYDAALRQAVEAALREGQSDQAIRAQWSVSHATVSRWRAALRQRGQLPAVRRPPRVWPQRATVEAALLAGTASIRQLAAQYGVSETTIGQWRAALVEAGRCAPTRRAQALAAAQAARAPVQTRSLTCPQCGQRFPYRYTGAWTPAKLMPVDWLCRACFRRFCVAWSRADRPMEAPDD